MILQFFLIMLIIFLIISIVPFIEYCCSKKQNDKIEYKFDEYLFHFHDKRNQRITNKNIITKEDFEQIKTNEYAKLLP